MLHQYLKLSVLALFAGSGAVGAQAPGCTDCRVTIAKIAELRSDEAAIAPSLSIDVARTTAGEFIVSHRFQQPALLRYNVSGRLLELHEKRGRGPGELNSAPRLFVKGDTLVALDGNRIIHFVRGFEHARTSAAKANVGRAVLLQDGRFVTTGGSVPRGHIRVITPDTLHTDLRVDGELPDGVMLHVSQGKGSQIWITRSNGSRTWSFDIDSRRRTVLPIERRWLMPWTGTVTGEPLTAKPRPLVRELIVVSPELLLSVTSVADPDWMPMGAVSREIRFNPSVVDGNDLFDVVLEFFDSSTGATLARGRHPSLLLPIRGAPDLLFGVRQTDLGHVVVDVWHVQLMR